MCTKFYFNNTNTHVKNVKSKKDNTGCSSHLALCHLSTTLRNSLRHLQVVQWLAILPISITTEQLVRSILFALYFQNDLQSPSMDVTLGLSDALSAYQDLNPNQKLKSDPYVRSITKPLDTSLIWGWLLFPFHSYKSFCATW